MRNIPQQYIDYDVAADDIVCRLDKITAKIYKIKMKDKEVVRVITHDKKNAHKTAKEYLKNKVNNDCLLFEI